MKPHVKFSLKILPFVLGSFLITNYQEIPMNMDTIIAVQHAISSSFLIHLSYVLIIFFLFLEKRKSGLIIDTIMNKNLKQGYQLDKMREELQNLHIELLQLVKENHSLNIEIQLLSSQINRLREDIARKT